MCSIALLFMLLFVLGMGLAYEILKILILTFLIGSVLLFIVFSILFFILLRKKFFTKYTEGWQRLLCRLLKFGLIIELAGNIICFIICVYLKSHLII